MGEKNSKKEPAVARNGGRYGLGPRTVVRAARRRQNSVGFCQRLQPHKPGSPSKGCNASFTTLRLGTCVCVVCLWQPKDEGARVCERERDKQKPRMVSHITALIAFAFALLASGVHSQGEQRFPYLRRK